MHKPLVSPLTDIYQPVAGELEQVEGILRREMRSDFPYVNELVRYGCLMGGKRLRPALVLLSAKSVGKVTDQHLTMAAAMEMVHTASLIHDDILDEACVRRHLATVNARWDQQASVLLGDFLFTHAFFLASSTGSASACQLMGRSTNIVCEGELRQKGSRGDYGLTESEYYEILDAKTAELCACSCHLGAQFAGGDEYQVECLTQYGRWLGRAFQIADDLLDVVGDESTTGKSLGTDLAQQKPTLPLIRALQVADLDQRQQMLALLQGEAIVEKSELLRLFHELGALEYARLRGREFADKALEQLTGLPESPSQQALQRLIEFVVERSH
jgi:octaprenyl-diphosphate synthase